MFSSNANSTARVAAGRAARGEEAWLLWARLWLRGETPPPAARFALGESPAPDEWPAAARTVDWKALLLLCRRASGATVVLRRLASIVVGGDVFL